MGVQPRRGGSDRAEGGWCRAGEGVGGRGRGLCPGAGAGRAGLPPPPLPLERCLAGCHCSKTIKIS